MTERFNYIISCGNMFTTNITTTSLRITTTTPNTFIVGSTSVLNAVSQITQNSAGTLEIGIAATNDNFGPGSRSGDAIIRSAENKKILLQTGNGITYGPSILISTAGNVAIGNTSVGVNTTGFERKLDIRGSEGVSISNSSSVFDGVRYGLLQLIQDDNYFNSGTVQMALIRSGAIVTTLRQDINNNFIIQNAGAGGVYIGASWTSWGGVSDKMLKTNFENIESPLFKVCSLKGTYYKFLTDNETQQRRVGVIAQDVQTVLPEAVSTTGDGKLGVNYTDLIPLMIEAIKEQKQEIDEFKQYVESTF